MKKLISLILFCSALVWAGEGPKSSGPILVETSWLSAPRAGKTAELQVSAQIHDETSDELTLAIRSSKGLKIKSQKKKTFHGPVAIHEIKTHVFKIKVSSDFKKGRVVIDASRRIEKTQETVSKAVLIILQ